MELGVTPHPTAAAFFDLDRTLITENSGRLWMMREYRVGRIGLAQLLEASFYLLLYRLDLVDMDKAIRKALDTVRGLPESLVDAWTRQWFYEEVVPFEAPGARPTIEAHRARGHRLVLLTSSSPYASRCAVEHFDARRPDGARHHLRHVRTQMTQ